MTIYRRPKARRRDRKSSNGSVVSGRGKGRKSSDKSIVFLLKRYILTGLYLSLIGAICVLGFLYHLSKNLPSLDELINPKYNLPTQIYDRDNNLITEFYTEHRVLIPFEKVPDVMVKALLAIEDNGFYQHYGISPTRMIKAFFVNIRKGGYAQGASTLTQQTAKIFLLSSDKYLTRKLKDILLALKMESRFTKNQILELYLNKTYFGHGAHGIEAAAQGYFSKNTEELNLAEAALLAGLPQAPSRLAPTASTINATRRRDLVLAKMAEAGYITNQQKIRAQLSPIELKLNKKLDYNETAYYTEHVRRYLFEKYGKDQLYRGGLKVYTVMDLKQQIAAQNALHKGLVEHDKRQGYRGPVKNLLKEVDSDLGLYIYTDDKGWNRDEYKALDDDTKAESKRLFTHKIEKETEENQFIIGGRVYGVVTRVRRKLADVDLGEYQGRLWLDSMRWARPVDYDNRRTWSNRLKNLNDILKTGDVIELEILDYDYINQEFSLALTQKPLANGGIFVMDTESGHVTAMSGGFDFRESEFNRAIQSKRQTGSAFKPIVYSLALDNSFTPASILDDTPFIGEGDYKPRNYTGRYKGKMSFRNALVYSENLPSLNLTKELGTKLVIEHARKMGITSTLPENDLTIVLGSASLTLMEMVRTFNIFADGGKLLQPIYISKIVDREGNVLEEVGEIESKQVLSEETAFLMTTILKDVVDRGSGRSAQAINRPSTGKTGTSNDITDAWYIGYVPQLIAGVYVGFDKNQQTLGDHEQGAITAAPIWIDFMKQATATLPILPFKQPDGINMVRINADSGYLDCGTGGNTMFEYFKIGTEPSRCHRDLDLISSESIGRQQETDDGNATGDPSSPAEEIIEEL
ncbi:MAG: PBP1A family penicillin-binding protein [Proteobacteria bacterium]|nr:PBP1A family penicillin-binding protein [Pseudomonadota bacterium]